MGTTLVGVLNFGFDPRYDGALKSAIMIVHGPPIPSRQKYYPGFYKLGFNTNTNVSFAVVMKKHHLYIFIL